MDDNDKKKDRIRKVQNVSLQLWSFLMDYLPLANAHATDFITMQQWDKFLPVNIRTELLQMTDKELLLLPLQSKIVSETKNCLPVKEISNVECGSSTLTNTEISDFKYTAECHDSNKVTLQSSQRFSSPYLESAPKIGKGRKLHTVTHIPPRWSHNDVASFLQAAKEQTLQASGVLTTTDTLLSKLSNQDKDKTMVTEFMSEKKCHEVDIMADVCSKLANHYSTDMVVDIGSGKGYLSTQLALHYHLPVIGVDSSITNTAGASRRAKLLGKQWDGLVRNSQHCSTKEPGKTCKNRKGNCHKLENMGTESDISQFNKKPDSDMFASEDSEIAYKVSELHCSELDKNTCTKTKGMDILSGLYYSSEMKNIQSAHECTCEISSSPSSKYKDHQWGLCGNSDTIADVSISKVWRMQIPAKVKTSGSDAVSHASEDEACGVSETLEKSTDNSNTASAINQDLQRKSSCVQNKESNRYNNYVPLTLFVDSKLNLLTSIQGAVQELGISSEKSLTVLLAGLHTCGGLGSSILKLFLNTPSAVCLCNVSCCYHLMEEEFVRSPYLKDSETDPEDTDFPLSQFLKNMEIGLGKTARNLASQSVHRIAARPQLQGETFFQRALLQQIMADYSDKESSEWHGLRKLDKRSKSMYDYTLKAFRKLGLSAEKLSPQLVAGYEETFADQKQKLAAFFQLKASLAPSVESLLLMDRLLFLLEQDNVDDAHLVQLFDPLTSPRCYGIVAFKKK